MSPSPPSATTMSASFGSQLPKSLVSWPKAACASLLGLATKAIRSYRAGLVMASGRAAGWRKFRRARLTISTGIVEDDRPSQQTGNCPFRFEDETGVGLRPTGLFRHHRSHDPPNRRNSALALRSAPAVVAGQENDHGHEYAGAPPRDPGAGGVALRARRICARGRSAAAARRGGGTSRTEGRTRRCTRRIAKFIVIRRAAPSSVGFDLEADARSSRPHPQFRSDRRIDPRVRRQGRAAGRHRLYIL